MDKFEFIKYKLSNTLIAFFGYLLFLFATMLWAPDNKITEFCLNTSATIAVGYLLYRQGEKNAMAEMNGNGEMYKTQLDDRTDKKNGQPISD